MHLRLDLGFFFSTERGQTCLAAALSLAPVLLYCGVWIVRHPGLAPGAGWLPVRGRHAHRFLAFGFIAAGCVCAAAYVALAAAFVMALFRF